MDKYTNPRYITSVKESITLSTEESPSDILINSPRELARKILTVAIIKVLFSTLRESSYNRRNREILFMKDNEGY